jgi:hypothetical protein
MKIEETYKKKQVSIRQRMLMKYEECKDDFSKLHFIEDNIKLNLYYELSENVYPRWKAYDKDKGSDDEKIIKWHNFYSKGYCILTQVSLK